MSKAKVNKSAIIRKLHDEGKTVKEIKAKTGYSDALVRIVLRNYEKKAKKSNIFKYVKQVEKAMNAVEKKPKVYKSLDDKVEWIEKKPTRLITPSQFTKAALDLINNPPHYRVGGVETIDFIEAKDLNYRLGNVVKYVSRAGKKNSDPVQDLEKAAWYLQREIAARKGA